MAKVTQQMFESVCNRIATSTDGIATICNELGFSKSSFFDWVNKSQGNSDLYARAKQLQMDVMAEQIMEIADTTIEGTTIVEKPNGVEITKGDMIQHRRLQIDARKWLMSKLAPRKYGDKIDITTGGEAISQTFFTLPDGTKVPV